MKSKVNNNKFVKKEITVLTNEIDEITKSKRYIICFKSEGILIPHPITDFIDKYYYIKSGSINTEKSVADNVVHFLNYIYDQVQTNKLKYQNIKGIKDLELKHLEDYLNYCGEIGNARKTVERKEYFLINLYYFLGHDRGILHTKPDINKKISQNSKWSNKNQKLSASIFYKKPEKEKYNTEAIRKKDFMTHHWNNVSDRRKSRLLFVKEFLLLASKEVPDVAFAVCLQIYGGLRAAECMNLTINSLEPQGTNQYGETGLVVKIRDRQKLLFDLETPLYNEQVKKTRDQSILIDPIVPYLLKKHLEWLKTKEYNLKNKYKTNQFALFINSYGQSMKTHTYRHRFNKLKNIYLGMLKNTSGRYNDFQEFRNTNWSTHICRGVFTNLCLDSDFSAQQTSIMRGDSSPDSMLEYTDILTASRKIYKAIDIISDISSSEFGNIMNEDLLEEWKKVNKYEKQ